MSDQASEVSQERRDVLEIIADEGGEITGYRAVADQREPGYEATRRLLQRMEEAGQVEIDSSSQGSIISLTSEGRDLTPYGEGSVGSDVGSQGEEDSLRLHGFYVQGVIQNSSRLPDEWMGVLQEHEELTWLKTEGNDWIAARDKWVLRFHKRSVTLQLREGCSVRGSDRAEVVSRAHSMAQDVLEWVRDRALPEECSLQDRYFISQTEIAFEGHPLAELADDLPGVPLSRFEVVDPDIREKILGMDASPGFPELEAESERGEEVAQTVQDEMDQYGLRPEAVQWRHDFETEAVVQDVGAQEAVHSVRQMGRTADQVDQLSDQVQEIQEEQSELLELKKEEKKTRSALMEQVRAINNLAQSNQELLEKEVVQEDPGSEVVQELQDLRSEVEELKSEVREGDGSSKTGQGLEGRSVHEIREDLPDDRPEPEIRSLKISTSRASSGSQGWCGPDGGELQVDPSSLQEGLRFKDLRSGKLLEIFQVQLEENGEGFMDVIQVRVAGTLKIWEEIPRRELARLLGTGRFNIEGMARRKSS